MEQKEKDSKRLITPAGAGLAAIAFFLPWVRACGQDISAAQIANNGSEVLWLILIAAVAIVVAFFANDGKNNLKKIKPVVAIGAILSLSIMLIKYMQAKDAGIQIRFGAIFAVIGFMASLFGMEFLEDTARAPSSVASDDSEKIGLSAQYVCNNCGSKVTVGEVCPKCASASEAITADDICGGCGAEVSEKAKFCSSCGLAVSTVVSADVATENKIQNNDKFCQTCGEKAEFDAAFCGKCGDRIA